MRREYSKPTIIMVRLQHSGIICVSGDQVNNITGNADLNFGGVGDVDARTKESSSLWDEVW